jgi:hypothetical protein
LVFPPNPSTAAAGLISSSNPEGSNWKLFEAAAAPGSWLMLLQRAGHTTFMKPPTGVEAWLLDRVFGGGEAESKHLCACQVTNNKAKH